MYIKSRAKNRAADYFSAILILLPPILLNALGVMMLHSTGHNTNEWADRHLVGGLLFAALAWVIRYIPLSILFASPLPLYILSLVALLTADVIGHTAMGAQRWIQIGPLSLQPSELCKISLIIVLARYFHLRPISSITRWGDMIEPAILLAVPTIFILRQPNLGTAITLCFSGLVICFYAGVAGRKFILLGALGLAIMPVLWFNLHDYQKRRVLTFLAPEKDRLGAGYNVIQSQIAIGSGGKTGLGFMSGIQNRMDFLPEKHTDFIFSVFAEEFGYFGVVAVIMLYWIQLVTCIIVGNRAKQHFYRLIAGGVASIIFIHVCINMAMISGMMPVVGIPLPFLSYGRSNLLTCWIAIGLLLNCERNTVKFVRSIGN